ncbi:MAG TPA: hypothetical protein HPP54_10130 [Nitrospinae bacterium]|jgi:hypothetical protein|nr:hypothetical protein [Nitrospinota bacterium]
MNYNRPVRTIAAIAAFACVCFVALPAGANNDLKNGFEDQVGRLLALETFNVGRAILSPQYRPRAAYRPARRPAYRPVRRAAYNMPAGGIYSHCNYAEFHIQEFCMNSATQSYLRWHSRRGW